jgi:uncharacterized protein (TIGR00299 family) protein
MVGGLGGDMFIAAMLDAFPQHEALVLEAIRLSSGAHPVACALESHRDHVLCGRQFKVRSALPQEGGVLSSASRRHDHVSWKSIRQRIENSALDPDVRRHAVAIFELLAGAEALVHGVALEDVEFHEVGAWDSIADIVGAAALIAAVGATRWTASAAPLGGGRVRTAHGVLPLPAPATTKLLMGLPTLDDGVDGERVTPTGAAILRHLCPPESSARARVGSARCLVASGTGFGTRTLSGISNHVRILCFQPEERPAAERRDMHVLEFEVDDQSAEDLALGLERIRAEDGVLDVTQSPVFGKKGRMMTHVQVLARHGHLDRATESCFRETTTIGLRYRTVTGVGLPRRSETVELDGSRFRVKIVERPGGRTAKTESNDVSARSDHASRVTLRRRAESAALSRVETDLA